MPVVLFANTGIQFIDVGCVVSEGDEEVRKPIAFELKEQAGSWVADPVRRPQSPAVDDESALSVADYFSDAGSAGGAEGQSSQVSVKAWDGLTLLCNQWFPIPYKSSNPFWCRGYFQLLDRQRDGRTVREIHVVLACDTRICPAAQNDGVSITSAEAGNAWSMHSRLPDFWKHHHVLSVLELFDEWPGERPGSVEDPQRLARTMAKLRAALMVLEAKLPSIQVRYPSPAGAPIRASLVLDLGNTRTSGILVEEATECDLKFCPLELRSYDVPSEKTVGVLETRFEFVVPPFDPEWSRWPETGNFKFPSIVRLGKDAERAAFVSASVGQKGHLNGVTGMSSPKRYLWDDAERDVCWRFANVAPDQQTRPIRGAILRHLTPPGPAAAPATAARPTAMGGFSRLGGAGAGMGMGTRPAASAPRATADARAEDPMARLPRKAGLVFVLFEILTQAYSQINSHKYRGDMPAPDGYNRQRLLANVLLLYPSGMTPLERRELKRGAQMAVDLWHLSMTDPASFFSKEQASAAARAMSGRGATKPTVILSAGDLPSGAAPDVQEMPPCDEAMAVQMCYLYAELHERFHGSCRQFLHTMGKPATQRAAGEPEMLRLASLDVGGGTTDIVIADYQLSGQARGAATIRSSPRFVDSVTIGGDDIVRALIEQMIFPQICQELGIGTGEWSALFRPQTGIGVDDKMLQAWRSIRPQLVQHIWVPIARHLWGLAERGTRSAQVRIEEMFEVRPPQKIVAHLNAQISEMGQPQPRNILDVTLTFRAEDFARIVRQVLHPTLRTYADIIAQFDCDLLLLAGRPSGLPVINEMLLELCPVPPGRIVALQGYPVEGGWFPFASKDNRIPDAKFCAVVGATIHYLATRRLLEGFVLDQDELCNQPLILGIANPAVRQIEEGQELFSNGQGSTVTDQINLAGRVWIGMRRIDSPDAPVSPLYVLQWTREVRAQIAQKGIRPRDVLVTVERAGEKPWVVTKKEVAGTLGPKPIPPHFVELKLQTIFGDDYWLDSGCF